MSILFENDSNNFEGILLLSNIYYYLLTSKQPTVEGFMLHTS